MKTKILLLILFSGLILGCCRSKNKITTISRENIKQVENIKVDSLSLQQGVSAQTHFTDISSNENKNEVSGDVLIEGKTEISNPFIFHHMVGKDTIQKISITGNAEYIINTHYEKISGQKAESNREESVNIFQDMAQHKISKDTVWEKNSVVSEETKKVKIKGFEITAWIFFTILGITLILIFFTYKYFKK
ncbi:hypothetical protein VUJ46_07350 [Chryseobacterium sp. MYb264]|uniref:hypothetical protein n=1 Tax=Chryseobacterium sp. MYb264 TaxID=2745153 RepID=UPI002E0F83F5|nr:hypothetical protein VUJ46_07350 [Chryseobacterium sp. MYb264]